MHELNDQWHIVLGVPVHLFTNSNLASDFCFIKDAVLIYDTYTFLFVSIGLGYGNGVIVVGLMEDVTSGWLCSLSSFNTTFFSHVQCCYSGFLCIKPLRQIMTLSCTKFPLIELHRGNSCVKRI